MDGSVRRRPIACAIAIAITAGGLIGGSPAGAAASPDSGCTPSIRDLGDPLHGGFSFADGVNASGTIVGTGFRRDGLARAVIWVNGHAYGLGVVGKYDESFAHGVGPDNTVVGELNYHQQEAAPFVYRHGTMRILPGLGGNFGSATGINAHGVITGVASDKQGRPHAVVWMNYGTSVKDLGIARGDDASFGTDLNDAGVVAGDTDKGDNERPALFTHGQVVVLQPSSGAFGAAEDINQDGRVVGVSFLPNGEHATTWGPYARRGTDLGVLRGGSFASLLTIDRYGRAGGGGDTGAAPNVTHAIVWPGHGPLLTLRPLSRHTADDFSVVREFGAHGEAVGGSATKSGDIHGTVWVCAFKQAIPLPNGSNAAAVRATARAATVTVPAAVSRRLAHARLTGR